jgi:hypothetical protein
VKGTLHFIEGAGFTSTRPNESSAVRCGKATCRSPRRRKAGAYNSA